MSSTKRLTVPKSVKRALWIKYFGKTFQHKCYIHWCDTTIDIFNFHVAHNIPHSKNGPDTLDNYRPVCASCNLSMSNNYTCEEFQNWGKKSWLTHIKEWWNWCFHGKTKHEHSTTGKSKKTN